MRRKATPERIKEVLRLYSEEKLSIRGVSKATGLSVGLVHGILSDEQATRESSEAIRLSYDSGQRPLDFKADPPISEVIRAKRAYQMGLKSSYQIAEEWGTDMRFVLRILRLVGAKIRLQDEAASVHMKKLHAKKGPGYDTGEND